MKNWLTIGKFSKEVALSTRTLRIYEQMGLIKAHTRGENKYRYYTDDQIELIERIKKFKSFGFSLEEIRSLLEVDISMNSEKLEALLTARLHSLETQQSHLSSQKKQIEAVLTSLKKTQPGLAPQERRLVMTYLEKISIVVAGVRDLEKTADYIKTHLQQSGKEIPVTVWDGVSALPAQKPFILVIAEELLKDKKISQLSPDVVVIKELSQSSKDIHDAYIQLYGSVGSHMATILNADDRAVVELAGNQTLRQGKTYYFSKNSGYQEQISKIGGVISFGSKIEIYGFNQNREPLEINPRKILGIDEETAFLASLAAVMDIGLKGNILSQAQP